MRLKLNIYTDETLTEIKRVAEADRLKVPYRVAIYIGQSLENINIKNEDDIIKFITSNLDKLDKIIKATFGISETELDCIDIADLATVGTDLYKWAIEKFNSIKSDNSKN
jgi:hypothetical protein